MKRGKVIGAVVLVAAIGLIVVGLLTEPGNDTAMPPAAEEGASALAEANTDAPAGARVFVVDAAQSEVYWRIYRSGPAARFGHNHVISASQLDGTIALGDDPSEARWTLSFPVAGLIIDDPELRARYGEEFESVPSDEDKAGTKENMLTGDVLNGEVYPVITLSGTGMSGTTDDAELPLVIEMLGRTITQTFPAEIEIGEDTVVVSGEYQLLHEDLGMEPFSILGGMMAVGDEIDFTYRIHAVASD
jgi:hypothetical protein